MTQEEDPDTAALLEALRAEGLAIQDRFAAEPVYGPTGKGYLKSVGVSEIEKAKSRENSSTNTPSKCG